MIKALIWKDYRLLQTYLRISFLSLITVYLVVFGSVWWITGQYFDELTQRPTARALTCLMMTLATGSQTGLVVTTLFAALIAGSTFTLERIDRSAEFLACLPPTRWQNLTSKLVILVASIFGMLAVHITAAWIAWKLLPYARAPMTRIELSSYLGFTSVIVCVTGFSLASSSLMKSNGGPALIGLLSPLLCVSIVLILGQVLDIPSEDDAFAIRYSVTCVSLGLATFFCGCFWYINRREP